MFPIPAFPSHGALVAQLAYRICEIWSVIATNPVCTFTPVIVGILRNQNLPLACLMRKTPIPLTVHLLRVFYACLGSVVPGLAVQLLWKMFTPRRRPLRETAAEFLDQAEAFTFTSYLPITGEPIILRGYRWGRADQVVLLVHGWESHTADFRALVPRLVEAGYAVAAFDMPAHGRSPGRQTNLLEMKQALHDYFRSEAAPYAVVAHSMGGTAAAILLGEEAVAVEKFVFVASPLTGQMLFEGGFSHLRVSASVCHKFYAQLHQRLGRPMNSFAFAPQPRLQARHLLAIYDTTDELVPIETARRYLAANPAIEQRFVDGIGHLRLLRDPTVLASVMHFICRP